MTSSPRSLRNGRIAAAASQTTALARTAAVGMTLVAAAWAVMAPAASAEEGGPRKAFRVCQDPNNLPFSNERGEGYENKLAELFAKELGLPVVYYSFPQRLAFIRNTLKYKLPGEDFRCDIVMGVPADYDQVSATKPYYRSTYALVLAPVKGLDKVKTVADFLSLDRSKLDQLKIGLYDRSPASEWLAHHQLVEQGVPYQIMNADPDQYPGEIIEKDLAAGKIDAAIVWGPIAGYFAKKVKEPQLTVLPLASEHGVKLDYPMAMGVRYGEREWKQQIETLIEKKRPEIDAILREYRVPVVAADASASAAPAATGRQ